MMTLSSVFSKTLNAYKSGDYSIISNRGGTRSGKTYSIMQLLYFILVGKSENLMISVVSSSLPHLKRGCMRDFEAILDSVERKGLVDVNRTDYIYTFRNNNKIEFFGADNVGKMHGSQRNILFVNEANFISAEKVNQLFVRTSGVKFIDYNPSANFWVDDYRNRPDFIEFHSTYRDNEFLSKEQVAEIESHKKNRRWWAIYGEGVEYQKEGLCYPKVIFDTEPHHFTNSIVGLDFGFHDPTAAVRVEIIDDKIYVEQLVYGQGFDVTEINRKLANKVKKSSELIIADSAEPQIIQELKNAGFKIKPCLKGRGSVFDGIQLCNCFEIHVVNSARTNMEKEFMTYSYEQDTDGNWLDIPKDKNNHAMDAFRYAVVYLRGKKTGNYSYSFV